MTLFRRQHGLSLIELMISMGIGLVLLAGLVTVFASSSNSQIEITRTAQQIENGRYSNDVLTQDMHLAGYYGAYGKAAAAGTVPDPCATGDTATLLQGLGYPIQAYRAADLTSRPSLSGTSCATWLTTENLKPGSDILVVRRANTTALAVGEAAVLNDVYLQANSVTVDVQYGAGVAITAASKADGSTAATIKRRNGTAGELRKLHVRIYFVSPCSVPAGGATLCTGSSDDGGNPTPTLKRLELGVNSAGTRTFNIVPVAEGVEYLKVEYGIDDTPSTTNPSTSYIGDGAPDRYVAEPTAAQLPQIVTAKFFVLIRNNEASSAFVDNKTYALGTGLSAGPFNDAYKRHAFLSEARAVNLSSRRETP